MCHDARATLCIHSGLPALLLFFGMLLLPDTPNSLAERGRPDQARKVLERIRGSSNVEEEMRGIITAVEISSKVQDVLSRVNWSLPQRHLCIFPHASQSLARSVCVQPRVTTSC